MPYCQNCGRQYNNERFCPDCGADLGNSSSSTNNMESNRVVYSERNPGVAVLLSFLIPGIGSLYAGKIGKGIAILLVNIASWIVGMLLAVLVAVVMTGGETTDAAVAAGTVIMFTIISVVPLVAWVYSMFAAYADTKEYNEYLFAYGSPPW